MKWLIDAQLPRRLAVWLSGVGHDAIHTLELAQANRTPDDEICRLADENGRIVVTKDDDFVYSHVVRDQPARLVLISTGNISNSALLALFEEKIAVLEACLVDYRFLEMTRDSVLIHD